MLSVPPPSLSMSSKQRWAAERNSPVNSAISLSAALLCASRAAARCSSLFASAFSIHSSHSSASMASRRRQATSTRPRESLYVITDAVDPPFLDVDFARAVLVEHLQRLLEARRVEEELQIFLAAGPEECYDFLRVERKW